MNQPNSIIKSAPKPTIKPLSPNFSSGPTTKHKDWSFDGLGDALLGRSHRSAPAKKRIKEALDLMRDILKIPSDYHIGILPASDTGAFEAAMWTMLGARGVDVFAWENFGKNWVKDAINELKLTDLRTFEADYGLLPDLSQADKTRDIVFTWNGTTSGVKVPSGDWIADDREGLTLCDATSAVFACEMPWDKLDVTTFSWQKVLGGEAQHGVMILSPRAVERLNSYTPAWPVPIIFRLKNNGAFNHKVFEGNTINTPSMMCIEDAVVTLKWARDLGGLNELIARSHNNLEAVEAWVNKTPWIDFLCADDTLRSSTSICLVLNKAFHADMADGALTKIVDDMVALLDQENVAYDFKAYRSAPTGFRLWGGATVETPDLEALFPWLEWAYQEVTS